MKIWTVLLAFCLAAGAIDASANASKRLGGAGSVGKQSGNVTQRQQQTPPSTPTATPAPTQAAPAAATAPKPAAAVQPAPKRPWGAMLGGLAAGLGLAWLASSLGLGAEFGQFLMFGLVALVIMLVIGMVMRRRAGAAAGNDSTARSPYAFQGAGAPAERATAPRQYSPDKVGNDASARPWEHQATSLDTTPVEGGRLRIGAALDGGQTWVVPEGFDTEGFVAAAKRNFITLQDAWDRSDLDCLRAMMTDDMIAEIRSQLAERETHRGTSPNQTDVVMLEAQLLGIEDLGVAYLASVEFSGLIREEPSAGPNPFREVWNMTKPKDGSTGWLVAGVQALQ